MIFPTLCEVKQPSAWNVNTPGAQPWEGGGWGSTVVIKKEVARGGVRIIMTEQAERLSTRSLRASGQNPLTGSPTRGSLRRSCMLVPMDGDRRRPSPTCRGHPVAAAGVTASTIHGSRCASRLATTVSERRPDAQRP